VVNQTLVLRINPESIRDGKIATFAKPENVIGYVDPALEHLNNSYLRIDL
jgi:hypothetical protein